MENLLYHNYFCDTSVTSELFKSGYYAVHLHALFGVTAANAPV